MPAFRVLCLLIFFFVLLEVFLAEESDEEIENDTRERCPKMTKEDYKLALNLLARETPIRVSERSQEQNKVYKKISRYQMKRKFIKEPYRDAIRVERLLINGRILLSSDEVEACIKKFYMNTKGDGARKLHHRIRDHYYGIGESVIQRHLNNLQLQRRKRPRFDNKSPLQPIQSNTIMERHQIDLVDMSSLTVQEGVKTYRYILSILDVFSRFIWLRALQDKNAEGVAKELLKVYNDFGPPKTIQCDQGSEFKGTVKEVCAKLNIKLIYSSSHHPQSQGKIERSHSTWKNKIRHDLLKTKEHGVCNWRDGLPVIQKIYNQGKHSSLGISPYECHFGIKMNSKECTISEPSNEDNEENNEDSESPTTESEIKRHLDLVNILRNKAKRTSDKTSLKMKNRHLSKTPPSEYDIGDEVLVKYIGKDKRLSRGGSAISAPKVIDGTVEQKDPGNYRYKIKTTGENGDFVSKWYKVDSITAKLFKEEQKKKTAARLRVNLSKTREQKRKSGSRLKNKTSPTKKRKIDVKKKDRFYRESKQFQELFDLVCRLQKESSTNTLACENSAISSLIKNARLQNLQIEHDNPGGGNCMFYAVSEQLDRVGISRSFSQLRRDVVQYLRENAVIQGSDGEIDFRNFFDGFSSWEEYLNAMSQDGEWGDNLVLLAIANLFEVQIQIVTSLPNHDAILIEPVKSSHSETLYLGHISELHYISLTPRSDPIIGLCPICGVYEQNCLCNATVTTEESNTCETFSNIRLCPICGVYGHNNTCLCSANETHDENNTCESFDQLNSGEDDRDHLDESFIVSLGKPHSGANDLSDTLRSESNVLPRENEEYLQPEREDDILKELVRSVSMWLELQLRQTGDLDEKHLSLSYDHRSTIFYHFLKEQGIVLNMENLDGEVFFEITKGLMDIYDTFREQLRAASMGLTLVYITSQVRRWLTTLNRRLLNAYAYRSLLLLLEEEDYDDLVEHLNTPDEDDTNLQSDEFMEE